MTENKRFGMVKTKDYDLYVPVDEMKFYIFPSFEDELDCIRVVNALNDLEEKSRVNGKLASQYLEENEQLKSDLKDCRKLKTKRLNKIRNHRAVIEDLGGSIRAYKGKIEQTNEKIDKIKEAMEDTGALTKRQLEEILND